MQQRMVEQYPGLTGDVLRPRVTVYCRPEPVRHTPPPTTRLVGLG
jgi:hypothetical protein